MAAMVSPKPTTKPPEGPPSDLIFRRRVRLVANLRELWSFRHLVRTLAERDFLARYKQAVLGVAWALITPLILLGAFSLVFDRVAEIDTEGVPYQLFALMGLVPWTFFSTSLNQGGFSLLNNRPVLGKVYCPREVFPIASMLVAAVDALLSLVVVAGLFAFHGFLPAATAVWVPVLVVIQVAFALGVALILSILIVYLRDLRHLVPMIIQLGLFFTPIGYRLDSIPGSLREVYSVANPLGPVIDGYRETVLYGNAPPWDLVGFGALGAALYLGAGYWLFKRLEGGIADVA